MALAKKEPETGRSKFTEERRLKLLEAFALGAHATTAAALAKISVETLYRWLRRGEEAAEDSQWNKFYLDVQEAKALPRERALKIIHTSMPDYPQLAWKYIERTGIRTPFLRLSGRFWTRRDPVELLGRRSVYRNRRWSSGSRGDRCRASQARCAPVPLKSDCLRFMRSSRRSWRTTHGSK
jgi:hypothetical protein